MLLKIVLLQINYSYVNQSGEHHWCVQRDFRSDRQEWRIPPDQNENLQSFSELRVTNGYPTLVHWISIIVSFTNTFLQAVSGIIEP